MSTQAIKEQELIKKFKNIQFIEINDTDVKEKLNQVIKVLLVVATDIELNTCFDCMKPLPNTEEITKFYNGNQTYYLGIFGIYPVCLVKVSMMGSLKRDASITTVSDALNYWDIKLTIMPGIAFGKDENKQKIGEILISETLSQYETVKEEKKITHTRGHSVPCSPVLLNRFTQQSSWINPETKESTRIIKCEILSGEKLINDKTVRDQLFIRFPNAQGGEMEGNGVYAACDRNKVDWIICKAICDWADGHKDDKWQAIASDNSVRYVEHILSSSTVFEALNVPSIKNNELNILDLLRQNK